MARLNVEDSLFVDPRFMKVSKTLGIEFALGCWIYIARTAQSFWTKDPENPKPIPANILENHEHWEAFVEAGMLEETVGGFYLKGSKDHFSWLQKSKAGAKRGGLSTQRKFRELAQAPVDPGFTPGKVGVKSLTLTPSLARTSSSLSEASQTSSSYTKTHPSGGRAVARAPNSVLKKDQQGKDASFFIAKYVEAYQKRYGLNARPDISGMVRGQVLRIIKDRSIERNVALIETYLQMDDAWFLKKCHDLTTFLTNINKVNLALDLGKQEPTEMGIAEIMRTQGKDPYED